MVCLVQTAVVHSFVAKDEIYLKPTRNSYSYHLHDGEKGEAACLDGVQGVVRRGIAEPIGKENLGFAEGFGARFACAKRGNIVENLQEF